MLLYTLWVPPGYHGKALGGKGRRWARGLFILGALGGEQPLGTY